MISASAAREISERGEAWTSIAGLPTAASRDTSQSSAFFRPPGTPCAYSGRGDDDAVGARHGVDQPRRLRRRPLAFVVGVEDRQAAEPVIDGQPAIGGALRCRAASNALLVEAARRLPDRARMSIKLEPAIRENQCWQFYAPRRISASTAEIERGGPRCARPALIWLAPRMTTCRRCRDRRGAAFRRGRRPCRRGRDG